MLRRLNLLLYTLILAIMPIQYSHASDLSELKALAHEVLNADKILS